MTEMRLFRSARRMTMIAIVLAAASPLCSFANQPQITKIEPPNWWTGFVSPVMVLLYGENLSDAKFSVSYPGVKIEKSQLQSDGKHAFVWLSIGRNAKSGRVELSTRTTGGKTTASLTL